jgi:hypothetical protein
VGGGRVLEDGCQAWRLRPVIDRERVQYRAVKSVGAARLMCTGVRAAGTCTPERSGVINS